MQIRECTIRDRERIISAMKQLAHPNLYNSYVGITSLVDYRPLLIGEYQNVLVLFSVKDDIEMAFPLGDVNKEKLNAIITHLREAYGERTIYIHGVTDRIIEFCQKSKINDMQISYILEAKGIVEKSNKKLRNALSKFSEQNIEVITLTEMNIPKARLVIQLWSLAEEGASMYLYENLLATFSSKDNGEGMLLEINNEPKGFLFMAIDEVDPRYLNILVNVGDKRVNGITEYLLWKAGEYAVKHNCLFLNYGGANPLDDHGLHTFKKKHGWDHIIIEYSLKI